QRRGTGARPALPRRGPGRDVGRRRPPPRPDARPPDHPLLRGRHVSCTVAHVGDDGAGASGAGASGPVGSAVGQVAGSIATPGSAQVGGLFGRPAFGWDEVIAWSAAGARLQAWLVGARRMVRLPVEGGFGLGSKAPLATLARLTSVSPEAAAT